MFGPERLADVETFKRLGTEEHGLEEIQQAIDLTGKYVGNCKPVKLAITHISDQPQGPL
jgi:hypothetical protein